MKKRYLESFLNGEKIYYNSSTEDDVFPLDTIHLATVTYRDRYRPAQGSYTNFYYSPKLEVYFEANSCFGMKWWDSYIKLTSLDEIKRTLSSAGGEVEINQEECEKYAPCLLELEEEI